MENYDVIIIGAGVTGTAIARELSRYQCKVCVLEREEDVCCGTSKANSAIIHAGYDAEPGSWKARLNVRGNEMIESLSRELDFPFKRDGSLVLCLDEKAYPDLKKLYDRGIENGVKDLQILNRDEVLSMEPNVSDKVYAALYAPTAGIVCPFHMSPLGQGVGVCEGIAKAVKVLLDTLGVWCVIAICGNKPEKGIKYRHTWNIVRIGGTYYHLDATFDNTLGNSDKVEDIRYDYFNLDDKSIFRDHEPLIAAAPHCTDHDHFYYREKKLSFTKTEDVYKRSLQAAKKGKTLTFHWRGGYLTREVLNELLGLIRKAGEEKNKTAAVNINWPQAVLRLHYTEAQMQECITMEDANEGEKE